ncbi:endonuclease III/DNA-(Apurinic or apyrimidinic site) lyase [Paenibacillus sp. NAIST15-1]|nr:endonuclease III/DNA-(Apurinic or apyrimidinic site) lyase [Paenibacillus sp. NAIST15-1]
MGYIEAIANVDSLRRSIRELSQISWDEVLSHVPESYDLLNEVQQYIKSIDDSSKELELFFK